MLSSEENIYMTVSTIHGIFQNKRQKDCKTQKAAKGEAKCYAEYDTVIAIMRDMVAYSRPV